MSKKQPMPPEVYDAVMSRAQGRCEVGAPGVCTRNHPAHWHHRMLRSGGGKHVVENGLAACSLCHDYIHREVRVARDNGWIVSKWADPAEVPVMRRGRLVFLDGDGWYETAVAA